MSREAQIGDVIDSRYRVTGYLGTGGMGSVYRAEHISIRQPVAIKLLHPRFVGDRNFTARFEREAFAAGQVKHPNCVTVSDFGRLTDGSLYLVMELVEGRMLSEILTAEGSLPPHRALHIIRQVLLALGHAHRADIVHRDVKPDNVILVDQDGDPDFAKILDFGIAKLVGNNPERPDENLTTVGTTVGTPNYVSPEQALGDPVDGRADLYSVSAMLFEMLAGRPPYTAEKPVDILRMHVTDEIPLLSDVAPEAAVTGSLVGLLSRGLAKERDERFPTAEEYIEAIDLVLDDLPADGYDTNAEEAPTQASSPLPSPILSDDDALAGEPTRAESVDDLIPNYPPPAFGPLDQQWDGSRPYAPGPMARLSAKEVWQYAGPLPQWPMKRWAIIGAVLLVVLLLAALLGDNTEPPESSGVTSDITPSSVAPRSHLGSLPSTTRAESSPEPGRSADRLTRGHEHCAAGRISACMAAYHDATEQSPSAVDNPQMRANIIGAIGSGARSDALPALRLGAVKLELPLARVQLVALATAAEDAQLRRAARLLVAKAGLTGAPDLVTSYALDLEQLPSCSQRKRAVEQLRALGDRRAIEPLEQVAQGPVADSGDEERDSNRCLRAEATEAIAYLESL